MTYYGSSSICVSAGWGWGDDVVRVRLMRVTVCIIVLWEGVNKQSAQQPGVDLSRTDTMLLCLAVSHAMLVMCCRSCHSPAGVPHAYGWASCVRGV
jgi:hypothetical protein